MKPVIRGSRPFYGWWIIIAALGIMFVQAGTGFYSFGIILKPLMNEFGWSRGTASVAQSIYLLMAGAGGLLVARMVEHHSIRKIVVLGAVMGGSCFLLLSLTARLWYLYALYFLLGIGLGGGAGLIPVGMVISNWFIRRRGTAMGMATAGIALGAMLLVPLVGFVTESFGWRMTYIFMGLLVFLVDIPLALFVLKTSPQDVGLMSDGDEPSQIERAAMAMSSRRHVTGPTSNLDQRSSAIWIRSLAVWLLCLGFTLAQVGEISILIHQVPFITDLGVSVTTAATALGFTGGMGGVGKVTFGWLTDKLSTRYVTMLCFAFQMAGVLILRQTHTIAMVWLFVIVFGFAMGGMVTLMPLAIADLFGMTGFGVIYSFVNFVVLGGSTVGPPLAGFIFDATGTYAVVFNIFAIAYMVSVVAIYFTWGPAPRPIRNLRKR